MRKFVAAGFGVVGNGRNTVKLGALENEIGSSFCGVAGDAADTDVLDGLFSEATRRFGKGADIVVVNAGRGLGGSVSDADLSQFEDVLRVNVTGSLALMQKAAREMVDTQRRIRRLRNFFVAKFSKIDYSKSDIFGIKREYYEHFIDCRQNDKFG